MLSRASSRLVVQSWMPCRSAMSRSLASLRPTRTGSSRTLLPSPGGTPSSAVVARTDQDRLEPDPAAVTERHAVVGVDRQYRPDQVLVVTHAPSDAVHDDPDDLA